MHANTLRVLAVAVSGVALGLTGAEVSGATTVASLAAKAPSWVTSRSAPVPGATLWVSRYNGPANGNDFATSVAMSPRGGEIFVTGDSSGKTSRSDFLTIAYNAVTGARLWASRYNGPASGNDYDSSLAVSPNGSMVFVTGRSRGAGSADDYATVAYRAATGAQVWVSRYNGPASGNDGASSVAVSPSGGAVYVTGESIGQTSANDYATVAYDAATGTRLWVKRYNGPANRGDLAKSVAVGPGGAVFVTGRSIGRSSGMDYATVAYNGATGARLWVSRYNSPANRFDGAQFVAVGPGGGKVFVTGESIGRTSGDDYATVAYSAATGARVWVKRYNGPSNRDDVANSIAVSPGGGTVLVTGTSNSVGLDIFDAQGPGAAAVPTPDYATVAYRASTGARLWASRYDGPGHGLDFAYSVAIGPNGRRAFVTGFSIVAGSGADYATIAYNTASGAQVWVRRYSGPAKRSDAGSDLTVSPRGSRVFVTGTSTGTTSGQDFATIAYHS